MQLEENEESIESHTDPPDEPENFCFPVSVWTKSITMP